jgi:uncharacterized protein (TIGR03086 family)
MPSTQAPLPTFIIIGAQKSGTRWLRTNLDKHPGFYTAPLETQFFHSPQRFETLGLDWYRAQFDGWNGEKFVGEATPGYMMWRHRPRLVAKRIKDALPDARLIAVLRNPVDRALSAMVHFIKHKDLPADTRLLDLVQEIPPESDSRCLVSGGWYAASLKPYRQLFGDQLLVLLHDDLMEDPQRVYNRALMHIGAPLDFTPPDLDQVVFSNTRSATTESTKESNSLPELSDEERQRLYAYFRPDVDMLQKMIGRDLSRWDPGGSYSVRLEIDPWKGPSGPRQDTERFDVVDCYERTAEWIEHLILGTSSDQYGQPTPCAKWSVRDLLNKLVWLPRHSAAVLRGSKPPKADERDFVGDDAATAYRGAADDLLAEMNQPGRLAETIELAFGKMFAVTWVRFVFVDQLTHGWDLATATGQDSTIPQSLLEAADQIVRAEFSAFSGGSRRPESFDVAVPVNDSATPTQRFVAFLGRDPGVDSIGASGG